MSSKAVMVLPDELEAVCVAHHVIIQNLGYYENIGKSQGACGKGLTNLSKFLSATLLVCPQCNICKTQWRQALLLADRAKGLNKSGLPNQTWAGRRAERLLTLLSHLRRLWRSDKRFEQATQKLAKVDSRS